MSSELKRQFVAETREQMEMISKDVITLEKYGASSSVFDSLFRQVHTLKGNCGLFDELVSLGRVLHYAEDQLDKLREGGDGLGMPEQLADLLLEVLDLVDEIIMRFDEGEEDLQHDQGLNESAGRLVEQFSAMANIKQTDQEELTRTLVHGSSHSSDVPQWVECHLTELQNLDKDVVWVRYCPDSQAFFQGEDPFLNVSKIPELLWAKAFWPEQSDNEMFDPFICRIQFIAVSASPLPAVRETLAYVSESCEFFLMSEALAVKGMPSKTVSADLLRPALSNEDLERARKMWLAQIMSLKPLLGRDSQDERLRRQLNVVGVVLRNLANSLKMPHWHEYIALALDVQDLEQVITALESWPIELQGLPVEIPVATHVSTPNLDAIKKPSASDHESPRTTPIKSSTSADSARSPSQANRTNEMLRVPRGRVDQFMELVGEMVVAKNALPFLADRAENEFGSREIAKLIREQFAVVNRIVDDMQDAVMRVRMTPVDSVFQRFPRLVRDLSRQLGKQVNLVIRGEDTEADKNMIERLADPMIHLVRNTLDHGIEKPEVRQSLGKPAEGVLEISASQDGDRVLLELSDDGAGVNREKVAEKAIEKGLITQEQLSKLKPQEIDELIFMPGFSTADQISSVSGRGVGMDAVRTSIESMGGEVRLFSEQGKGLRVSISLPLSMAVSRVMVIESGGQQFGIPVEAIVETVRKASSEFKSLQGAKALVMRNRLIPIRGLNDLLDIDTEQVPNEDGEWAILVCRVRGQRMGLLIDDFKGTADVLIKPMEGSLQGITHFQGTALLGDGSVLLVLDLMEAFCYDHSV